MSRANVRTEIRRAYSSWQRYPAGEVSYTFWRRENAVWARSIADAVIRGETPSPDALHGYRTTLRMMKSAARNMSA